MEKQCTVCGKTKFIDEFGTRKGVKGARASCKQCDNNYQKAYYKKNIEKCRSQNRAIMARLRLTPEGGERQRGIARKCWQNGGRERQQAYLDRLKESNYFKWKARKSYIWLTEEQLRELWEKQQGLCALTGRVLDHKAELDHIVPKTRGGKDTYENSQWLDGPVNQAKRNLLDAEFIALCAEVVRWSKKKASTQNLSANS